MARIIVVDDDAMTVDFVRAILERQGHIVGALDDGAALKATVELKRPHLVILDCQMPRLSGIEALRQIRTAKDVFDTPILMLTGRQSHSDEAIAWNAGADDYLRKPVDPDELVVRVEGLLSGAGR